MVEGEKKISNINSIKEGSYIIIEGEPCKVNTVTSSKAGKHGHAKIRLMATGLFDGKKRETVMPSGENVEVPVLDKRNAQVLSITGNMANIMDSETFETFDLEIPEELTAEVKEGVTIIYWVLLHAKTMKQVKND